MQENYLSQQRFADLPLHPIVQKALQDKGFEYCTPIQALSLPITLQGKDVAGQAQTGTGKNDGLFNGNISSFINAST